MCSCFINHQGEWRCVMINPNTDIYVYWECEYFKNIQNYCVLVCKRAIRRVGYASQHLWDTLFFISPTPIAWYQERVCFACLQNTLIPVVNCLVCQEQIVKSSLSVSNHKKTGVLPVVVCLFATTGRNSAFSLSWICHTKCKKYRVVGSWQRKKMY